MSGRYAVYFVPADDSPLAAFGNSILGRDAYANALSLDGQDHPLRSKLSSAVSHYGFHATLKAPFELRSDKTETSLREAVWKLADSLSAVQLTGLRPRRMHRHLVLNLESDNEAIRRLATRCVIDIEPFRTPNETDAQRRMQACMTERQRRNLKQYGYAYILDDFRFHMTLGGPIPAALESSDQQEPDVGAYLDWLSAAYDDVVTETPFIDRIALCFQPDRQSAFVRLDEWVF